MELNQITLPVNNMKKSVQFYLTLSFTLIVDTPHYTRFICPDSDSIFSLAIEEEAFENHSVVFFTFIFT